MDNSKAFTGSDRPYVAAQLESDVDLIAGSIARVLKELQDLREEVQMLRKIVQPVIGGPVLGRPEKEDESPKKYPDAVPYYPYPPQLPPAPPPWPGFPQPWVTWTSGPADPRWNGRSP